MTAARWRPALPWLALLLVLVGAGCLRYGLVEAGAMAQRCDGAQGSWWCAVRQLVVLGFLHDVFGIAAVIAAALALFVRRRWLAWLAAALGLLALQLYGVQTGALALLVGCLRLLRLQAGASPRGQHGQRQGQVQPQP